MSLPNFLVIGPAKCGTTSIHYYLKQHPEVYLPRIKEINFFAYYGQKGRYWAKTLEEYKKYFKDVKNHKAVGEVTPFYFAIEGSAEKIQKIIPDTKIITILRNPIDRAYSHYNMSLRIGREKRDVSEALTDINSLYVNVGFYYRHLQKYYKRFKKEKIKILFYDQLVNTPVELIKELYQFIGVDTNFIPDLETKHAAGYLPKSKIVNKIFDNYFTRFILKPILPARLLNFGIKIKNINSRKPAKLPPDIRNYLIEVYKPDMLKLERLANKQLNNWYA